MMVAASCSWDAGTGKMVKGDRKMDLVKYMAIMEKNLL